MFKLLVVVALLCLCVAVTLSVMLPLLLTNKLPSVNPPVWKEAARADRTLTHPKLPYNVVFSFCIRDCGKYLKSIFANINRLKPYFNKTTCVFVYDNCKDDSEKKLKEYQETHDNVIVFHNKGNNSPLRTVRIANSRNVNVNILYHQLPDTDFHIVVDADERNADPWDLDVILSSFARDDWDCLSFNRPVYYDIWALLFDQYKHHCWGFGKMSLPLSKKVVKLIEKDVSERLAALPEGELMPCYSAFNGFAIYRTPVFKGLVYDGLYKNVRPFFTDQERLDTLEHIKQQLSVKDARKLKLDDGVIMKEQADHVYYHLSAIRDKAARIRISPRNLFINALITPSYHTSAVQL